MSRLARGLRLGVPLDQRSQLSHRKTSSSGDVDQQQVLACEIQRQVLMGLEESELADALGRDARRREVGHAAILEFQAHIRDVNRRREHGQADGADLMHWRINQREYDIEVVDHQV